MHSLLAGFRDRYRVPAVGAAIVTPQGDPRIEVVGVRRRGYDAPVAAEDQWHIGSCGKSITAALFARLVERGEAVWGAPVTELFPDLADRAHPGGASGPSMRSWCVDPGCRAISTAPRCWRLCRTPPR